MPPAIYILGLSIFAQGTSELMLAGLLPEIATDLHVSIPEAGLLISAFALGMLVGAPLLAALTLRWPRRRALLVFLALFAVDHAAGALTASYTLLFASRALGAAVYAGFWAVATVTAVELAGERRRARAMSVVAGGLTVATVLGLPVGTAIGQHLGWRAAFWVVAAMSAVAMIGVAATVRDTVAGPSRLPRLGVELREMVNPRLWLAYATTALATASLLVTFSYLAPTLTDVTGLPPGWVPVALGLYGAGALIGILIGGRTSDSRPFGTLYIGIAGLIVTSLALAVLMRSPVPTVALVFLLGCFGFLINPVLNTRAFSLVSGAPTLAAATNVSAFNAGIMTGPWLGGLAIDARLGYPSLGWIAGTLGTLALGTVVASTISDRRRPTVLTGSTRGAESDDSVCSQRRLGVLTTPTRCAKSGDSVC